MDLWIVYPPSPLQCVVQDHICDQLIKLFLMLYILLIIGNGRMAIDTTYWPLLMDLDLLSTN